jgi:dihydroorotase-like cyclic amidohydrolase
MVIKNQTIATHQEIYVADIHIENGLITKVIKKSDQPNFNNVLLPGFVDIHTHGGYG